MGKEVVYEICGRGPASAKVLRPQGTLLIQAMELERVAGVRPARALSARVV